ncbi:MAG TPA: acetate/propionate family kinase [Candidatus Baltobacteraceae bacterium]
MSQGLANDAGRDVVLTLNAGSSSIKFALFSARLAGAYPAALLRGEVDGIGHVPELRARDAAGKTLVQRALSGAHTHEEILGQVLSWIDGAMPDVQLAAAGHRVVHGGMQFAAPVIVNTEVRAALEALVELAPLHEQHNLAAIDAVTRLHPGLPQVACFDTAFHATQPWESTALALPAEFETQGVRRYGFHGLSYEFIASVLVEHAGDAAEGRVVVAHLGSGASMCAMQARASLATTMGFSALDGLPMGTRCGALDPGVVLYLLERGWTKDALEDLLWRRSGLLGLSGISDDVRALVASGEPRAARALGFFAYRIARELGSLAAALGGLDVLVFTAGIGEHASSVRSEVCRLAQWLGIELDGHANERNASLISTATSKVGVYVIPTDEESVVARHTLETLNVPHSAS